MSWPASERRAEQSRRERRREEQEKDERRKMQEVGVGQSKQCLGLEGREKKDAGSGCGTV